MRPLSLMQLEYPILRSVLYPHLKTGGGSRSAALSRILDQFRRSPEPKEERVVKYFSFRTERVALYKKSRCHPKDFEIFARNLAYEVNEEAFDFAFLLHGFVVSTLIKRDFRTGASRGIGFVKLQDPQRLLEAIKTMSDSDLYGRRLALAVSRPPAVTSKLCRGLEHAMHFRPKANEGTTMKASFHRPSPEWRLRSAVV